MRKDRNVFHFSPESNWMNDPNGMVYYEDEYHLFYQYHPFSDKWGPMHWGHAVSPDMIHWNELPISLYPDELGTIFSGSAIVDSNNTSGFFNGEPGLVAIFTHHSDVLGESQSIAYSKDKGRTWTKYEGNPVLQNPGIKDFRDPKVFWYAPAESWIMVLACNDRVRFYSSLNLKDWVFLSEFGSNCGSHSGVWECPDLFELPLDNNMDNRKWVLKVDVNNGAIAGGSGGQYFIGNFDGKGFINDNPDTTVLWVDYGQDFYAAQSWSDLPLYDGRRIWLAWNSNWQYANDTPTNPWRGTMTIPRRLSLKSVNNKDIRLKQEPIQELQGLRKEAFHIASHILKPDTNLIPDITAEILEIIISLKRDSSGLFTLLLYKSNGDKLTIGLDFSDNKMFIDRSETGNVGFSSDFACRQEGYVTIDQSPIEINVIIDRFCLEVFADDGLLVFTDQIFPCGGDYTIELCSCGGEVNIGTIDIYDLAATPR